ncbi:hypothetical protein HELRODRAFT_174283 [Helobdella robusta]|uniref:Endonuclease/exonuclease/phosphatase domain-containing protein n=1 Tax=Helobdella robusta TaxID=6412 RepID=T1F7X7_HELRO|nr:hypothetical protein HELRODRAFT_174283 [Helobdella robusta]ESO02850.1 hypothetical protein HELRODRAFT_174283 [Helobdella robusta]
MFERTRIDICCLQETRWKSNGVCHVNSDKEKYKLFWNGQKTAKNGDLNGNVGEKTDGFDNVHGGFGNRKRNDDGNRILEFAESHGFCLLNTYFRKRLEHLITYKSGPSVTQIDFFAVKQQHRRLFKNVKVIPGESCALCAAEDETDIQAAECAKAEQKEELAEFDENLPWEDVKFNDAPNSSCAVVETKLDEASSLDVELEQLNNKSNVVLSLDKWELDHLKALKEEEERKAEDEEDEILYVSNVDHSVKHKKIKFNKSSKIPYLEMKKMHFLARKEEQQISNAKDASNVNSSSNSCDDETEDICIDDEKDNTTYVKNRQSSKANAKLFDDKQLQVKKYWKKNSPLIKYSKQNKNSVVKSKANKAKHLDNSYDDIGGDVLNQISLQNESDNKGKRSCPAMFPDEYQCPPNKQPKLDIKEDILKHITQINNTANSINILNNVAPKALERENNQSVNYGLLSNKRFILPNNQRILVHRFARPNLVQSQTVINSRHLPSAIPVNKIAENKLTPILEKLQNNVPSKMPLATLTSPAYLKTNNVVPKSTNHIVARSVFMPSSSSNDVLQFLIEKNSTSVPKTVQTPAATNYYILKNPSTPGQNFFIPTTNSKTNIILVPNAPKQTTSTNSGFILLANNNIKCDKVNNGNMLINANINLPGSVGVTVTQQTSKPINIMLQRQSPVKQITFAPSTVLQNFQLKTNRLANPTTASNTIPILEKLAMQLDKQNKMSPPFTVKLSKFNSCFVQQPLTTNAAPRQQQRVFLKTPDGSIIQSKIVTNADYRYRFNSGLMYNNNINNSNSNVINSNNKAQSETQQILILDNSFNNFTNNTGT